jgi:hypothetical protein
VRKVAVAACALAAFGAWSHAARADCGLPSSGPLWVDFAGHDAPIPAKPGLTLAVASGTTAPAQMRAAGAATVMIDLNFNKRVGTTTNPADPSTLEAKAQALFAYAQTVTGCATPTIAENELSGAQTPTPWSTTNAQYRQNVLSFLTDLATLGAHPLLEIANPPYTSSDDAKLWWQQVSQVAVLLRQVYFTSPNAKGLYAMGPVAASRAIRESLRGLVDHLTQIGIPSSRVALELQFTSSPGLGSRAGLEPTDAWLEVVKLEALGAKEVAGEFKLQGVWSWGWAVFSATATVDPDKARAACVWLWVIHGEQSCDAPRVAGPGFDTSLTEGQLILAPGVRCSFADGATILRNAVARLTALTGDPGYAASVLLEQETLAANTTVSEDDVLSAERAVIAAGFAGDRARYQQAVAAAKLTLGDARAILAARLEQDEVEARFAPAAPAAQAIADFVQTYAAQPVRLVSTTSSAPWLGGAERGWAISTLAPPEVFTLSAAGEIDTPDGVFDVTPDGAALPLGVLPAAQADGAARTALEQLARASVYESWLRNAEAKQLAGATCLGDQLPTAMPTDLSAFVPFLLPG